MNAPKISVLVPVYKVEAYLQRCIDSVLSQDFLDWEMILVDDGSPDRCPQICDEAAEKDERIRVVHKENGGLVSARLAGFREARGAYFVFLDSDDWLPEDALQTLLDAIEKENADVVVGTHLVQHPTYSTHYFPTLRNATITNSEEYAAALLRQEIFPYLWGGIYRRDLFTEESFHHTLQIGEDMITNLSLWRKVKKYRTVDDLVYVNRANPDSLMHANVLAATYVLKQEQALLAHLDGADKRVLHSLELSVVCALLKTFFQPELDWDEGVYLRVRDYSAINIQELRNKCDSKHLRFLGVRSLYKLYTMLYRSLFLHVKLKGQKRRVLR